MLFLIPSRLFWFAPVIVLLLLRRKSRNITKYLMSGPSGNQLVLFPSTPDVSRDQGTLGKTKLTVSLGI